ncbi:type II secretion system F family protein [Planctomicrobium sp. SH664]|uniref:type II secretion system F family protein n=1 Tax=Planctomicrobium sp. SH664 TaxID=3448125 RepID=UPI003F5C59E3
MAPPVLTPRSDYADILRVDETYAVEGDRSAGNQLNNWFDTLMVQAGMGISPAMMLALSICSSLTLGGLIFVLQENFLTTAMGAFVGFLIPTVFAMFWRSRRQGQMARQLPPMIDELARAAKTGRSLENCMVMVANDTPSPLGSELRICTRKLALGMNVDAALKDLPFRTGLVGTSILSTALSVHRQTGGDLVRVLQRLSQTLRDRMEFQGRLRAATAASRATAILMITLPPAILAFFVFRDPNYLNTLLNSSWGLRTTLAAFFLEFIGAIWVIRVLSQSRQV